MTWSRALRSESGELTEALLGEQLAEFTDAAALTRAWRRYRDTADAEELHSAHMLARWLQQAVNRPVVPD